MKQRERTAEHDPGLLEAEEGHDGDGQQAVEQAVEHVADSPAPATAPPDRLVHLRHRVADERHATGHLHDAEVFGARAERDAFVSRVYGVFARR